MQKKIKKSQMVKMIAAGVATGVVSASAISAVVLAAKPDSQNINNDLVGDPAPTETVYDLTTNLVNVDIGYFPSIPNRDAIISRLNSLNDGTNGFVIMPSFNDLLVKENSITTTSATIIPGTNSRQYTGEGTVVFKLGTSTHEISDDINNLTPTELHFDTMPSERNLLIHIKAIRPVAQINQIECEYMHYTRDSATVRLSPISWGSYYKGSAYIEFDITFTGELSDYIVNTDFVLSFPEPSQADIAKAVMDANMQSIGEVFTVDDIVVSMGANSANITVPGQDLFAETDIVAVTWKIKTKKNAIQSLTTFNLGEGVFPSAPNIQDVIDLTIEKNPNTPVEIWQQVTVTLGSGPTPTSATFDWSNSEDYTGTASIYWNSTAIPEDFILYVGTEMAGFNANAEVDDMKLAPYLEAHPEVHALHIASKCTLIRPSVYSGSHLPDQISELIFDTPDDQFIELKGATFTSTKLLGELKLPKKVILSGECFNNCKGITGTLVLPDSVTTHGQYCFQGTGISEVIFPSTTKTIGASAFRSCPNLTSVTIPDSVETIQGQAFRNDPNLTTVNISKTGSHLTEIQLSAFADCVLLNNFEMPNSLITMGNTVFSNCPNFYGTFAIPANVEDIGYGCFTSSGINSINYSANTRFKKASNLGAADQNEVIFKSNSTNFTNDSKAIFAKGDIVFPTATALTKLAANAFSNSEKITSITIPAGSLTEIGSQAFLNCRGITGELTLPGLTILSEGFRSCSGITKINFPTSGMATIGDNAFRNMDGLKSISSLPTDLVTIGAGAFAFDGNLKGTLKLQTTLTTIGEVAFAATNFDTIDTNSSTKFFLADNLGTNAKVLFAGTNKKFTESSVAAFASGELDLTVGTTLTALAEKAFYYCQNITGTVKLPSTMASIGANAFYQTLNVEAFDFASATIPGTIGASAFANLNTMHQHTIWLPLGTSSTIVDNWQTTLIAKGLNGTYWHVAAHTA